MSHNRTVPAAGRDGHARDGTRRAFESSSLLPRLDFAQPDRLGFTRGEQVTAMGRDGHGGAVPDDPINQSFRDPGMEASARQASRAGAAGDRHRHGPMILNGTVGSFKRKKSLSRRQSAGAGFRSSVGASSLCRERTGERTWEMKAGPE
jgi:hypothetical protein